MLSYYEPEEPYFEVDENFEFNTGVNGLLEQEVEKRLQERVKGYERAIERDKDSTEKVSELKKELRTLNKELEEAEKTFTKQGENKAKREILGGFKLGDEVWFVKTKYENKPCESCGGNKKVAIELKGEKLEVDCPKCRGYGHKQLATSNIEKGVVKEIEIHTWAEERRFEMSMYIQPSGRGSDSVNRRLGMFFKTEQECKDYIESEKAS